MFVLFHGDELIYDLDDKGKVKTVHPKHLYLYINIYYKTVENFEKLYFTQMSTPGH